MDYISLHSTANWLLIYHLWPMGTLKGNLYYIYIDAESTEDYNRLNRLSSINPALAETIRTNIGGIIFSICCPMAYPAKAITLPKRG